MLQHDHADDFVLATGETHSVREFVNAAFTHIGVGINWVGKGIDEYFRRAAATLIDLDQSRSLLAVDERGISIWTTRAAPGRA